MTDLITHINEVHRQLGSKTIPAGEGTTVVLRRRYDATVEDVWDAVTSPERLSRWFLKVTGDFRLGGNYALEGNAHGEILRCEPPRLLGVTWVLGEEPPSEVEVRLTPDGDQGTMLELEHAAVVPPEFWDQFGPGAVGVGWDLALLGLLLHLRGQEVGSPAEVESSPEMREYMTRSSQAWGDAYAAAGAAPDKVAAAVEATTQFYVPDTSGQPEGGTAD